MIPRRSAAAAFVLALALLLTGCAGFTLVKGGDRVALGGSMSIEAPRDWNSFQSPRLNYWTLDGPNLQHIIFVKGIADGEAPWATGTDDPGEAPQFRKTMSAIEIGELVQATMALEEFGRVGITGLEPVEFAGHSGFAFDIACTDKKGLDLRGRAVGAVVEDRLYMIVYRGAKLHYFHRTLPDFEKIVASARIGDGGNDRLAGSP